MSKSESAFKLLYTEMIKNNGNFGNVKEAFKKPIKCFVKEAFPFFLVSDGFFAVPLNFTKGAIDEFKSKFSNVNIVDLSEKVIVINKWHLEMKKAS